MKKPKGFTMIELVIGLVIIAIFVPSLYLMINKIYDYYYKVSNRINIRTEISNACYKMQRDIKAGGTPKIDPGNRSLTIRDGESTGRYFVSKGQLIKETNNHKQILIKENVEEAVFLPDNGTIAVNLTVSYNNLNSHRRNRLRIIRNLVIK